MKLSRKYKRTIKKRLLTSMSSITIVLMLLAISKLAGFSAPFYRSTNSGDYTKIAGTDNLSEANNESSADPYAELQIATLSETADVLTVSANGTTNRLQNTNTITYIYDAADLVAFRNAVNAGNNYSGKTVYLMDDIDLSTVCSSSLGSWVPIGATGTTFAGTFNGNYHTISNLYINSGSYSREGLFSNITTSGIIQNVLLDKVSIYNSYNSSGHSYTGGITGGSSGKVQNCGVLSGSITGYQTTSSSVYKATLVGGIVGDNGGAIDGCFNKAKISGTASTSGTGCQARVGGITGGQYNIATRVVSNCYNAGAIVSKGYWGVAGGIVGIQDTTDTAKKTVIKNCYNYGSVSANGNSLTYVGGVVGANGQSSTYKACIITNSYCTTATTYMASGYSKSTANRLAVATLKTYTVTLGSSFAYDVYNQNSGYPILAWQNETTVMSLNKNQAYIGVGENLALNVVEKDEVTEIIGNNYSNTNFTWTSTNEDVATVNENGVVTGVSDGYTTIYAYHEASGMYAMCVVNVAKNKANPQIETGNGFSVILKADGTVWTIGNNANGTLRCRGGFLYSTFYFEACTSKD